VELTSSAVAGIERSELLADPLLPLIDCAERHLGPPARSMSLKFFYQPSESTVSCCRRWLEIESPCELRQACSLYPACLSLLVVDGANPITINPLLDSGELYDLTRDGGTRQAEMTADAPQWHAEPASRRHSEDMRGIGSVAMTRSSCKMCTLPNWIAAA
jgi:hypothetical protein